MKALIFFMVGVMTLLFFSMPQTLELTAGTHDFDIKQCEDCHESSINDMVALSGIYCTGYYDHAAGGHAVDPPLCRSCHLDVVQKLQNSNDPHRNIAFEALESDLMEEENEACLMCHSRITTRFEFSRPPYIEFDMIEKDGDWHILNFTSADPVSREVSVRQIDAETLSGSDFQCRKCHPDITSNINAHYYPSSFHPEDADCSYCHLKSESQHTAANSRCVETCHQEHTGGLMPRISRLPGNYQSHICAGCHNINPENKIPPAGDTITHFRVMLEPDYGTTRLV